MSDFKGTRGPWEVVENPDSGGGDTAISNAASIYSECETYVADVYRGYVGSENVTAATQSANARLIAASPRMYDYIAVRARAGDKEAQEIISGVDHAQG